MPQFTVDWFCHNIASWERVFDSLGRLKTDESIKALEQWGLDEQHHDGHQVLDRFKNNVAEIGASNRVTILQQPSYLALANLIRTQTAAYDIVYIDGSHEAPDVLTDAVMAWKLLAEGGIMILDDYEWDAVTKLSRQHTPKIAIDAFLDIFSEELHVLVLAYQCIVQKHRKDSKR